jgi:hypothetical protein
VVEGRELDEAVVAVPEHAPPGDGRGVIRQVAAAAAGDNEDGAVHGPGVAGRLLGHALVLVHGAGALVVVDVAEEGDVDAVPLPQLLQALAALGLLVRALHRVPRVGGVAQHAVRREDEPRLVLPVHCRQAVLFVWPQVPHERCVDEPGIPPANGACRLTNWSSAPETLQGGLGGRKLVVGAPAHAAAVEGERAGGPARGLGSALAADGAPLHERVRLADDVAAGPRHRHLLVGVALRQPREHGRLGVLERDRLRHRQQRRLLSPSIVRRKCNGKTLD